MIVKLDRQERSAFRTLLKVVSSIQDRPVLRCLHVEAEPGLVRFVVADGFRLAGMEVEAEGDEAFSAQFFASMVETLLAKGKRNGKLVITAKSMKEGGGLAVAAAQIDQPYPEWRKIAPRGVYCDSHLTAFTLRYLDTLSQLYNGGGPRRSSLIFLRSINSGPETPHAWAWERGKANYLYVLMPMHVIKPPELSPIEHWIGEEVT